MCGRFVQAAHGNWVDVFGIDQVDLGKWTPSYNLSPTDPVLIVADPHPPATGRRLTAARWSLIPPWSKTQDLRYPTFNARSESAAERPTFRTSVRSNRCLIPADGYYEWRTRGREKTPFYIHPQDAADTLAFAGLYSWWRPSPDVNWTLTTTILTRDAIGALANVHDRMPVCVDHALWNDWLSVDADGAEVLREVAQSTEQVAPRLDQYEVAPLRGDGAELIAPLPEGEQP